MENLTSLITSLPTSLPYSHVITSNPNTHFLLSSSFILIMSIIFLTCLKLFNLSNNKSTQLPLPPGPKPWPIIGCLPIIFKNKPLFRWIHSYMDELNTEIACIRLGNVHTIIVTSPNLSCEFLKAQDSAFASRPISMSTRLTSNGYLTTLFSPFGEQWQKMKRILVSQMLSPTKHKFFHAKRLEEANHLVRYVYNLCTKPENDGLVSIRLISRHYVGNLTRNIVLSKRSFGEGNNDGGPNFEDEEHLKAIFIILAHTYTFCISDYFPCLVRFDFGGHDKLIKEAVAIMNKYQDPIIEERFQKWSTSDNDKEAEDLLDMFVTLRDANGNPSLSKQEIQAQLTEIMLAIVHNPSNVVEWALAEMINQPKIMAKVVEELDRVIGKERLVEESDFSQLNYIKACIREAFRLHPIAPFNIPHVSIVDTTIANYFIPKGSHILLSRMGLGRNPKVWDEPEKFDPERHMKGCDQVTLSEPDLRFFSFSTGRRGCPGEAMGTSITLMLFARLLQGFTWNIPSDKTSIDLSESCDSLSLAKPLIASAMPRLPTHLYYT